MDQVAMKAMDRRIFTEEFAEWLPTKIFDAHIHLLPLDAVKPGFNFPEKSIYLKHGGGHTLEQFQEYADQLLPGREISFLSFSTPGFHIDIERACAYSAQVSDNKTRFSLSLVTPQCRIEDVKRRIEEYRLLGYKPYRNMVEGKSGDEVEIFDMLTREQLEYANAKGLLIMLHIPKSKRLADPSNQKQMVELCVRYPNIKVIFAHIGRAYYMKCVEGMLDGIAECPNAYVDTSPCCHPGVLEYAWRHFPRERILFASDAPVGWLRGKPIEVNNQYAYLMGADWRVGTSIYDAEGAIEYTCFYYEQLRAVKEASTRLNFSRKDLDGFFHDNAMKLARETAKRL